MKADELLRTQNTDADAWAKAFMANAEVTVDQDLMRTWFANAIENAKDSVHNLSQKIDPGIPESIDMDKCGIVLGFEFYNGHILERVKSVKDLSLDQRVAVFSDTQQKYHFGHISTLYSEKYSTTSSRLGVSVSGYKNKFLQLEDVRKIRPIATRCHLYNILKDETVSGESKVELLRSLRDSGLIDIKLPANLKELHEAKKERN